SSADRAGKLSPIAAASAAAAANSSGSAWRKARAFSRERRASSGVASDGVAAGIESRDGSLSKTLRSHLREVRKRKRPPPAREEARGLHASGSALTACRP